MLVRILLALALSGCSVALGTPASVGWPSGDPGDYVYSTGPSCHVYRKTTHVDTLVTLASAVVAITGAVFGERRAVIVGGAVGVPFAASAIAGNVGRSRCQRWGREQRI